MLNKPVFLILIISLLALVACQETPSNYRDYNGEYRGQWIAIKRYTDINETTQETFSVADTTRQWVTFTLQGNPWTGNYDFWWGDKRDKLSSSIGVCRFNESGACKMNLNLYVGKFGPTEVFIRSEPNSIRVERNIVFRTDFVGQDTATGHWYSQEEAYLGKVIGRKL